MTPEEWDRRSEILQRNIEGNEEAIRALRVHAAQNDEQIRELQNLLARTVRVMDERDRRVEERINALILMFERRFGDRLN
jgi:hypothetical protein